MIRDRAGAESLCNVMLSWGAEEANHLGYARVEPVKAELRLWS
jgi:hypothetical protein